jgi:hypothetical protein
MKWEYLSANNWGRPDDRDKWLTDELNYYGEKGWELVFLELDYNDSGEEDYWLLYRAIFKRPMSLV